MVPFSSRLVRYARAWLTSPEDLVEEELTLDRDGVSIPASIVHPRGVRAPLPAWIVLHGITRPGRAHTQLVRFTRAVASSGMVAIVPEVPEWRELSLAPNLTRPTVRAALEGARRTGIVRDQPLGLVGFSFGAPHAIATLADPELRERLAGVCGFGGYCTIEDTIRFLLTGIHEWAGRRYRRRPDPYGRWIVAANYLTAMEGHGDADDVARALRDLAKHSGDVGAASWDPVYDPEIRRLRASVSEVRRPLFDLLAPESSVGMPPEPPPGFVHELAAAARRSDPLIDPSEALRQVRGEVHILHGRSDHLIPFTEGHQLYRSLETPNRHLTVTRLFGHSGQEGLEAAALAEIPVFARALSRVLSVV